MPDHYPATYRDRFGEEQAVITNDNHELTMTLRGVDFAGRHVMGMQPTDKTDRSALASFALNCFPYDAAELCSCVIDYRVVLPVSANDQITEAALDVHAEMGDSLGRGMLDRHSLLLTLHYSGISYSGIGQSGCFEDELLQIQAQMPFGAFIKACINCALSDYSVYGSDIFGDLGCYRNNRDKYLAVKTKHDYMTLNVCPIEYVQETYLCPAFERRKPGTGYRG